MKQIIYILVFAIVLSSCSNQTTEKNFDKKIIDTIRTASVEKQKQDIYIKDKSQYDEAFVEGLLDFNESIKLIDNYILTGNDTTYFPNDLSLNVKTTFKGTRNNNTYLLTVSRTNLTNLNYRFQLLDKENQTIFTKSGNAILGSLFFLASEMDDDDLTKDGYGCSEYWDKTNNCFFSIRIGIGLDDTGEQRAIVTYDCTNNNNQTINLEDCPTLRTE